MIELEIDLNKNLRSHRNKIRVRQGDIGEKVLIKLTNSKKDIDFPEGYSVKFEGNLKNNDYVQGIANPYNNETTKFVYQFKSEDVSVPGAYRNAFFRVYDENDNRISSEEVRIEVLKNADMTSENARYYLSILEELIKQFRTEFEGFIDENEIVWSQYLEEKEKEYQTLNTLHAVLKSEMEKLEAKQSEFDKLQQESFKNLREQLEELQNKISQADIYTKEEANANFVEKTEYNEVVEARESKLFSKLFDSLGHRLDFLDSIIIKNIPVGFRFVIEHDSEMQPEISVTSYRDAIDTEEGGLETSGNFGGATITNVPTQLSFERHKAYIEMPIFYALNGEISIPATDTLLIINGNQTLCFKVTGASITKGYYNDGDIETVRPPKDLRITLINDDTIKLIWERGDM